MKITDIFGLLGGLALFLYGMQMMSAGLETAAGNRMKQILCINLAAALAFACAGFLWKWRTQVK